MLNKLANFPNGDELQARAESNNMIPRIHLLENNNKQLFVSSKVEDVRLHETDPTNYENKILSAGSEELRSVLERHDLRFSFQDGIVDELCPSSDEVSWALNIKRGILSVFQNSMDDLRRGQKTTEVS